MIHASAVLTTRIRRRAILIALPAAIALLATGCPATDRAPRPGATLAGTPQPSRAPHGEIRVAWPAEPATLNPFVRGGESIATRSLVRPLMPALFLTGPGGTTQPSLADRIVAETPREVRFTLRSDAVWSDGRPITADDLRFTWKTIIDPRTPVASRDGYDAIADIQSDTPKNVRITFNRDMPAWRDLFSAGLGVLPQHALAGKDFATQLRDTWPVSGGPFVLERYTRGLEIVLAATPQPWGPRAGAQRIRISFVPDSTTALQLFERGQIDVVGPYSSPDFARRLAAHGATVTTDIGATWTGLVLNAKAGVLTDPRVRRAAALAIDANELAVGLVRSEGTRLTFPFTNPPLAADADARRADPAAAARLLDEAGFTGRRGGTRTKGATDLEISIATTGYDDMAQRVVRGIYGHLRAVGFAVNLVALEDEQLWRDWLPSTRMQAAIVTVADPPGGALRARYHSAQIIPAGINIARIADPALDAAVTAADPARTAARLVELAAVIPLWHAKVPAGTSKKIQGVRAVASADGFFTHAAQWRPAA